LTKKKERTTDDTIVWQGKDVEQLELAYIVGENTEMIDH